MMTCRTELSLFNHVLPRISAGISVPVVVAAGTVIILVAISFPSAAPAPISPLAGVPAAKHPSVHRAIFAVLEHAFAPIWVGRIDPERFDLSRVGINAKH